MLFFNLAQTFYLDKSVVKNANEVGLTRVDLYFRAKPPATNNKSGILEPGVELKIVPCLNGIPIINQMGAYRPTEPTEHGAKFAFYSGGQTARVEYNEIMASANARVPTPFIFSSPIFVKTDLEYALVLKYDGNENFVVWTSVAGQKLVGTNIISTGPSSRFSGTLFHYIDDPNKQTALIANSGYAYSNTVLGANVAGNPSLVYTAGVVTFDGIDTKYLQSNWSPIPNEDLKFKIYVARYFKDGVAVSTLPDYVLNSQMTSILDRPGVVTHGADAVLSNGVVQLAAPVQLHDYITFDMSKTVKDDMVHGEPFFQDGPLYPGGTATPLTVNCAPTISGVDANTAAKTIIANGSYVMAGGSTFAASGGFNNIVTPGFMILLKDATDKYHMRIVQSVKSNTEILVDAPFDTTLTGAKLRIAPIGYLYDVAKDVVSGRTSDLLTLYNSFVADDLRFIGHSMQTISITGGGTGYSNSDYIKITGFEEVDTGFAVQGNYAALANVVTNGSGTITAIHISNSGAGFVNTAWLTGANVAVLTSSAGVPSNTASAGSGATFGYTVNSVIRSVFTTTAFANCAPVNLEIMRMKPEITVNNPLGSSFTIRHRTLFHSIPNANTFSGKEYHINTEAERSATDTYVKIFKGHTINKPAEGKTPCLTSRSNEFAITYANGDFGNSDVIGDVFSNTSVFIFDISSNSDFQAIYVDPEIVHSHYAKYIVNSDYSNEHTNFGNAFAKHVTTKVNLKEDRYAEDMLVYLTAYRPANTDIKVYARLHNSNDETAFDDLDWTLLEIIDGANVFSSKDDTSNYVELTYNLRAYPNTDFTMNGSVTLEAGNLHVIGNNTIFGPRTTISVGGTGYSNSDVISFTAPTSVYDDGPVTAAKRSVNATFTPTTNSTGGITALTLINAGYGWESQSNTSTFTAANSTGGASGGSGATLVFNPGLQSGDMIKVYSPYDDWANSNYTIAIVNSVISNTDLTVQAHFGDVSANKPGLVDVGTNSPTINGVGTAFLSSFEIGDMIAVWSNSSVYEVRKITAIANNTNLTVAPNTTFTNTAAFYAQFIPENFMNSSITVTQLKLDRIAYPHQAWNNVQKDNVARYYSTFTNTEFDTFDTFQLKVVLLSEDDTIIPRVDDVRAQAVSA